MTSRPFAVGSFDVTRVAYPAGTAAVALVLFLFAVNGASTVFDWLMRAPLNIVVGAFVTLASASVLFRARIVKVAAVAGWLSGAIVMEGLPLPKEALLMLQI